MYDRALQTNPNHALTYSSIGTIIMFILQEMYFQNKENLI